MDPDNDGISGWIRGWVRGFDDVHEETILFSFRDQGIGVIGTGVTECFSLEWSCPGSWGLGFLKNDSSLTKLLNYETNFISQLINGRLRVWDSKEDVSLESIGGNVCRAFNDSIGSDRNRLLTDPWKQKTESPSKHR